MPSSTLFSLSSVSSTLPHFIPHRKLKSIPLSSPAHLFLCLSSSRVSNINITLDSLPTPRRRRTTSPPRLPTSHPMEDSLRLPPLRFSSHKSSADLKCVLPPITPPPRLSPNTATTTTTSSWQPSSALPSTLPSPATISPPADLPNFPRLNNPHDPKFSPITHTPPSTIRPLPPPSVLPAAGTLPAHSNVSASSHYTPVTQYPQREPYSFPPHPQPSAPQPALQETYPRPHESLYQAYGSITAPPVVPWRQTPNLPGPAHITGSIQRGAGYSEFGNHPFQIQRVPQAQVISDGRAAEPVRSLQGPGGYYNDGTPIQRVLEIPAGGSAGAGPSTQPQQQATVDVKSPLKKTISTARGVRDVYACPYPNCTRVSTEQSNMKAHMRMHTGEKPYVCRNPGCMKAFRWKSSLTYHEKALHVKSRPFKCSPCRRSFVEKRKLRMHFDLCPVIRRHREQGERGDDGCRQ